MIEKINLKNYEKCYPKRLKRFFKSNINYKNYDLYIPNMEKAIVGNWPHEIIHLLNKSNRCEHIKIFQNALSEIAFYIRENRFFIKNDRVNFLKFKFYNDDKIKIFNQIITNRFNNRVKRILPKDVHAQFELEGSGGFAHVFKFSLFKKNGKKIMHDKAFKVFYYIQEPLPENKSFHNNYAEANFWTFLKYRIGHKMDKTQFTRHYISDLKSGYNISEFIDEEIAPTVKPIDINRLLKIFYSDLKNNKPIRGKYYDAGGFIKLQEFIDDKVVHKYYKKIVIRNTEKERNEVLSNLKKLVQNSKTPHRDKILKAIEIYEQEQKIQNPISFWQKLKKILENKLFKQQ